jgi:hypothetical protein
LHASVWTEATADKKAAALVMATRLIDSQFQFNGNHLARCKGDAGVVRGANQQRGRVGAAGEGVD